MSKVCGVFSNRRWPSTSERQARATTKSFIVLGVTGTTVKNLGWGSSCLVLGGDASLWSSGDHFSPSGIISLKIFTSTHTFYVKVYKMVESYDPLRLYEMHLVLYFFSLLTHFLLFWPPSPSAVKASPSIFSRFTCFIMEPASPLFSAPHSHIFLSFSFPNQHRRSLNKGHGHGRYWRDDSEGGNDVIIL